VGSRSSERAAMADAHVMEPEHLAPDVRDLIKFHLAWMTAELTAAKDTTDPDEADRHWAEYRRHQDEVDRLLPPNRRVKRPW